jgi:hypothetical protein
MKVEIHIDGYDEVDKLLQKFLTVSRGYKSAVASLAALHLRNIMDSTSTYRVTVVDEKIGVQSKLYKGAKRLIIGPGGLDNLIEKQTWDGAEWAQETVSHVNPDTDGITMQAAVLDAVKAYLEMTQGWQPQR